MNYRTCKIMPSKYNKPNQVSRRNRPNAQNPASVKKQQENTKKVKDENESKMTADILPTDKKGQYTFSDPIPVKKKK